MKYSGKFFSVIFIMLITFLKMHAFKDLDINFEVIDEENKTCQTKRGDSYGVVSGNPNVKDSLTMYEYAMNFQNHKEYTVVAIGERSFMGNDNITYVSLPSTIQRIEDEAFGWCKKLSRAYLPRSLKKIGNKAFARCDSLTLISLPDSLIEIGNRAFTGCSVFLEKLIIPNSVEKIGKEAFQFCKGINEIIIGKSVKEIGGKAFYGNENVKNITCLADIPPKTDYGWDRMIDPEKILLFVPEASLDSYKNAPFWEDFANILPYYEEDDALDDFYVERCGPMAMSFQNDKEKIGLYSLKEKEFILEPEYDEIEVFGKSQEYFKVKNGDKWAIFSMEEKKMSPFSYDNIKGFSNSDDYKVEIGDKVGYYDNNKKKWLVDPKIYSDYKFLYGNVAVKKNGKWGIIDYSGKQIIPFLYEDIAKANSDDKLYKIKLNGNIGIATTSGKVIIAPNTFDDWEYKKGYIVTKKKGKVGVINSTTGKVIASPIYPILICKGNGNYIFGKYSPTGNKEFVAISEKGIILGSTRYISDRLLAEWVAKYTGRPVEVLEITAE